MRSVSDARAVSANLAGFLITDHAARPAVHLIAGEAHAPRVVAGPVASRELRATRPSTSALDTASVEGVAPGVVGLVGGALASAKSEKKSRRGSHGGKRGSAKP